MACVPTGSLSEQLAEARVAFVGTVTATTNSDRDASVSVESIWLGPRLPERVRIEAARSPEPRVFEPGGRYLFVPRDATPPFLDDGCTATQPYTPSVARFAPEGAVAPGAIDTFGAGVVVVLVLLAVGVWQVRRARRRAEEIDV